MPSTCSRPVLAPVSGPDAPVGARQPRRPGRPRPAARPADWPVLDVEQLRAPVPKPARASAWRSTTASTPPRPAADEPDGAGAVRARPTTACAARATRSSLPAGCEQVDYEAELVIVFGRECSKASPRRRRGATSPASPSVRTSATASSRADRRCGSSRSPSPTTRSDRSGRTSSPSTSSPTPMRCRSAA